MIAKRRKTINLICLAVVVSLFSACATTLAPSYDKAIFDSLTQTNTSLMELFSSVSSGTNKSTFDERKDKYNKLVGSLDALVIQARARPIPKNKVTDKVNKYLESRGVNILDGENAPSAIAIEGLSKTIVKMRDTDEKQGVTSFEVSAFKGQVVIYMDQALTYESFLKR